MQSYLATNRLIAAWQNSSAAASRGSNSSGASTRSGGGSSASSSAWGVIAGLTSNNATVVGKEVVMDGKVQMRHSVVGDK